MTESLQTILSELRGSLKDLYGKRLAQLVLYGSQARGDAKDGSDIDVLVVLKGAVSPAQEISRSGQIIADMSLAHDVVINCVFMDEERYLHRNGPLLRNVRREGIPL